MKSDRVHPPQNLSFAKSEKILFVLLILIFLVPIWGNKYFVTQDGPCHLYNAKILLDFARSDHLEFYKEYYSFNEILVPNWFSHVFLAVLLSFLPNYLAEKVFLTILIVLYAIALQLLIRIIQKENTFLAILGLPLIVNLAFQLGFFNFSYSIVLFLLAVGIWLKIYARPKTFQILLFSLFCIMIFFAHPVGYVLTGLTTGTLAIIDFIQTYARRKGSGRDIRKGMVRNLVMLFLAFLPSIILLAIYLSEKGLVPAPKIHSFHQLYHEFLQMKTLKTISRDETFWALSFSVLFGLILLYTVYQKIKFRNLNRTDAFLLLAIIVLFLYFNLPDGIAGGGFLSMRLQLIPHMMLLLWFSSVKFSRPIKMGTIAVVFIISIALTVTRFPYHALASEAIEEYSSVADHIADKSTVLPLSFSHNGKTPAGDLITPYMWLFMHASDYIGTEKTLILFGNYEATTGYFPIVWKTGKNPFFHISTNEGIEFQPPSVDILSYNDKTGGRIDYVITWCLDEEFMEHDYTRSLLRQLSENYCRVFTSEHGRVKLYQHHGIDSR